MSFLRCVLSPPAFPLFGPSLLVELQLGLTCVLLRCVCYVRAQTFRSQSEASGFSPQVVPRDPVSGAFIVSAAELGLAD